jgi:hypothetical protein
MDDPDIGGGSTARSDSLGPGGGESDGERGERQVRSAEEATDAAARAERLERKVTRAGDSVGIRTGTSDDQGVGRDADPAHGESGDAG